MHRPVRISIAKLMCGACWLLLSVPAFSAGYYNVGFGFKVKSPSLSFSTSAQSLLASLCSGVMTVQTKNAAGVVTNVTSNLTVNLSGPAGVTFYSDSTCLTSISSVVVATGTSSSSYYFIATNAGSASLTAAATGYTMASQSETINTNPYVWTGGGANANWATGGNWSGGAAPGSSDIAIFNGTCVSNCSPTIAANISIGGLSMRSGYAGTITQSAGVTVAVGSSGWTQVAGIFTGGSSTITVSGDLTISGGTFTPTSGTMTVSSGKLIIAGGTFAASSGTINADRFSMNGGTFTSTSGTFNVGFYVNRTDYTDGFVVTGGTFNHNNGTVKFVGSDSDFASSRTATVIKPPAAGLTFYNLTFSQSKSIYYDVKLMVSVDTSLGSLQVANNLSITDGYLNGGTIGLAGNLSITCVGGSQNAVCAAGGSTVIRFNGSSAQTYSSDGLVALAPPIEIASSSTVSGASANFAASKFKLTSGTFTAPSGTFNVGFNVNRTDYTDGFVVTGGTFNHNNGTVAIVSSDSDYNTRTATVIKPPAAGLTFYNLTFSQSKSIYYDVKLMVSVDTSLGSLQVANNLSVTDGYLSGGTIRFAGNLSVTCTAGIQNGVCAGGGTTNLTMNGTGAQSITVASGGLVPTGLFSVSKSAGTASLASALSLTGTGQNFSLTSGTFNMSGFALSINSNLSISSGATFKCSGACGAGTACGQGSLTCGSLSNSGTITP